MGHYRTWEIRFCNDVFIKKLWTFLPLEHGSWLNPAPKGGVRQVTISPHYYTFSLPTPPPPLPFAAGYIPGDDDAFVTCVFSHIHKPGCEGAATSVFNKNI